MKKVWRSRGNSNFEYARWELSNGNSMTSLVRLLVSQESILMTKVREIHREYFLGKGASTLRGTLVSMNFSMKACSSDVGSKLDVMINGAVDDGDDVVKIACGDYFDFLNWAEMRPHVKVENAAER